MLFYLFGAVAVGASLLVIAQRNPVYSVLLLILAFGALSGLYVLLDAPFVAVIQIIVYAGAIMVLFTFVVMLLNAGREERTLGSRAASVIGFPSVVAILAVIATVLLHTRGLTTAALQDGITSTAELSTVLFTKLLLPFEVTSVLILIAILGAVALARQGDGEGAVGK